MIHRSLKINEEIYFEAQRCIAMAIPENTSTAYSSDMVYVNGWLKCVFGSVVWPMNEEIVLQFILHHLNSMPQELEREMLEQKIKKFQGLHAMNTVRRRLLSISLAHVAQGHDDPCKTNHCRALLSALAKTGKKAKKSKPITKDVLCKMLDTCKLDIEGVRDRAMLLFAWSSGGRRRSEVSDAQYCNLELQPDGSYVYHMPRSKTDQHGKGHDVPVKGLAATAMKRWLRVSGMYNGSLFRSRGRNGNFDSPITYEDINNIIKTRIRKAGLDPKIYSSHGIRRGFVSEAGKQGIPLGDIMALTGHKSVQIAMGYYEAGALINNKAADLF